jgi:hypothetical protein
VPRCIFSHMTSTMRCCCCALLGCTEKKTQRRAALSMLAARLGQGIGPEHGVETAEEMAAREAPTPLTGDVPLWTDAVQWKAREGHLHQATLVGFVQYVSSEAAVEADLPLFLYSLHNGWCPNPGHLLALLLQCYQSATDKLVRHRISKFVALWFSETPWRLC